jgi:zinc D-Ala-D-Ala dipeptidase
MNKIKYKRYLVASSLTFFLFTSLQGAAQDTTLNQYGLWVIKSTTLLKHTITHNSAKQIVNVKKHIPTIVLDLRYASTNNFMHQKLYPATTATFLRLPAAVSLAAVQKQLQLLGLGIKIFDAYRPYSVTEKMWEPVKDDRYVSNPKNGSGHNRGTTVDLTIIELKTNKELDMGTGFDNFSDTAHHNFTALPDTVLKNRRLLKTIMEQHGFKALDTEWWHYSLPNARDFELLDISFKALLHYTKKIRHVTTSTY